MTFLIDGYNLLHAVGWATRKMPAGTLEGARRRLLDWVAEAGPVKAGAARAVVVWDAQNGRAGSAGRSHKGVLVQFAYGRTADDLIEDLVAAEPAPRRVAVVSNDGRLHEAARRAGAAGWACQTFVDWVVDAARADPASPHYEPPEKPAGPPPAGEAAELLQAFDIPQPKFTRPLL